VTHSKPSFRFALAVSALLLSLSAIPAAHATQKKTFCQFACVGVDPDAKQVMLIGPVWAYKTYRMDSYLEAAAKCRTLAEREGFTQAISAKSFAYRSRSSRSESDSWAVSMDAASAEAHSSSSESSESHLKKQRWSYQEAESAASARAESSSYRAAKTHSFSSDEEFSISVTEAAMTDPSICSVEELGDDWVPPYEGNAGGPSPRG